MSSKVKQLDLLDLCVFGSTLLISLAIGIYFNFKPSSKRGSCSVSLTRSEQQQLQGDQGANKDTIDAQAKASQTTNTYLLGDQQMSVPPVSFSLMASFLSAITLIGLPAEIYNSSIQFVVINISYLLATPIAANLFLPIFYNLRITSVYEYLEMRFSYSVRCLATIIFMMQMISYMGIVLYAPALALSAVTTLDKWASVLVVGIVCTIYCVLGGIKAVLWTDLFQSLLMFISLLLLGVKGAYSVGGFGEVMRLADEGGRLSVLNFSLDPTERHTVWSLAIGGIFLYLSLYGVNQTQVQRMLTLPTLKQSKIALWISWPITSAISLLTCFCGLAMYAYFKDCDPLLSKQIETRDQLVPLFMIRLFDGLPGLSGLVIAGIFAGSLSTVSSFVNSLAAVTIRDLSPLLLKHRMSEQQTLLISKLLACFYGSLCLLIAYLAEQISGLLEASLSIFGVVGGPLLALFTLGMCYPRCTNKGAIVAFLTSLTLGCLITFGASFAGVRPTPLPLSVAGCLNNITSIFTPETTSPPVQQVPVASAWSNFYLFRISYMWIAGLTWSFAISIGLIISYVWPEKQMFVDEKLIVPMFRQKQIDAMQQKIQLDNFEHVLVN